MSLLDRLKIPEKLNAHDLDHPSTTLLHAKIIKNKPFLSRIYRDFYRYFSDAVEPDDVMLIEIGSGAGFLKEVLPRAKTSDVIPLPHLDYVFSGLQMPFENESVDAFFMMDVLHHVEDSRAFFKEMDRCLKPGGRIVMVEPANTLWGRFIYKNFHHEPFDPKGGWGFVSSGPLSDANGAIPWIIFCRDRARFKLEFPHLAIEKLKFHTPFRYLLSGGLSLRQLVPSFTYSWIKGLETLLTPLHPWLGMFMTIQLKKTLGTPSKKD